MYIHVVQEGDTITSIALKYEVSVSRLIKENELSHPNDLVLGQTIVVTFPNTMYMVKRGDTLESISKEFGIPIMQIYRNNPYLIDREVIYPGEKLVVNYNTKGKIETNAYAFPFIDKTVLKKTLPYLTYLSVFNYKSEKKGYISTYFDDSEIIETAKRYGVAPLLLISTLSIYGVAYPETAFELLLSSEYQDNHIENILKFLKEKGFYGVNLTFRYLSKVSEGLYYNYYKRIYNRLSQEGYAVFVTVDPNFVLKDHKAIFDHVDYTGFNNEFNGITFMSYNWGTKYSPPEPISSVNDIKVYLEYVKTMIPVYKMSIGFPTFGYDWELPFVEGYTKGNSIKLSSVYDLARIHQAAIKLDENSKTPYFEYTVNNGNKVKHIVWFVDARTFYEISNIVLQDDLQGSGMWNVMDYSAQLWLVLNSTFQISKLLPEI